MTARGPKLPRCTYEIKRGGQLELVEAAQVPELAAHLVTAGLDQDAATAAAYLLAHHKARVTAAQAMVCPLGGQGQEADAPAVTLTLLVSQLSPWIGPSAIAQWLR